MVPMGEPRYGFAGARRTLGGGGNAPMPTGPAHNVNGMDWMLVDCELVEELTRSRRTTFKN